VALEGGGTLVTADADHVRRASRLGSMVRLRDWQG
jgi:hypothetical protein